MTVITVDKGTYQRAQNVLPNPRYGGLLTNSLGNDASQPNRVEFEFDASFDGDALLEFDYAANESRPVQVYFNQVLVAHNALAGTTGGWTEIIRSGISRVRVVKGSNTIAIIRSTAIPHLGNGFLTVIA